MTFSPPVHVLIAEDDALLNDSIARQVTRLGYTVTEQAYDGPRAVELAVKTHPAVVLMDLQMIDPVSGREDARAGFKAVREIQKRAPSAIILLTAHESPDLIRQAGETGVSAYVVKPARDNELDRAIAIARARFADLQELKRLATELKLINDELANALAKVKTLSGLLPICAYCKKVRDDRGYWQQVDLYLQEHSEVQFSHGLCPECCQQHYPDVFSSENGPTGTQPLRF
jgi:two-component system, response regulator PdtaR